MIETMSISIYETVGEKFLSWIFPSVRHPSLFMSRIGHKIPVHMWLNHVHMYTGT